jgi:hypothetical protein
MSHTAYGTTITSARVVVHELPPGRTIKEHDPAVLCSDNTVRPYAQYAFPGDGSVVPTAFAGIFAQTTILTQTSAVLAIYTSGVASVKLYYTSASDSSKQWPREQKVKLSLGLGSGGDDGFILHGQNTELISTGLVAGTIVGFNGKQSSPIIKFGATCEIYNPDTVAPASTDAFRSPDAFEKWSTLVAPLHTTRLYVNATNKSILPVLRGQTLFDRHVTTADSDKVTWSDESAPPTPTLLIKQDDSIDEEKVTSGWFIPKFTASDTLEIKADTVTALRNKLQTQLTAASKAFPCDITLTDTVSEKVETVKLINDQLVTIKNTLANVTVPYRRYQYTLKV